MQTIIPNQSKFNEITQKIKQDGVKNLHFLSDFDRTLTYGTLIGKKTSSIISILRDNHYLTANYSQKAQALFDKFYKWEIDPDLSISQKKQIMQKWWRSHFELLIQSGLHKADLESIVEKGNLVLRKGVREFLKKLNKLNIPIIIFSSSGAGEAIEIFFEKNKINFQNVYFVINRFRWNKSGKAKEVVEPIIHSFNKDETLLKDFKPIFEAVKDRKNVILMGDNLGDLGMVEGFDYNNLFTIGFLNSCHDQLEQAFYKSFDVIFKGDGALESAKLVSWFLGS
ncbi:MAG: hypothetical protein GF335_01200 [Candidatus Moranbacteria bacterium]|nr:hypothetical protein [Candidatus Moranbacteria bacterium]